MTSNSSVRVSVVGAGSAVFSLQLVKDLCSTPTLEGSDVVLMDIDEERLDAVTALAKRCAAELGSDVSFRSTVDREAALRECDFVVNVAYASGHKQGLRISETTARSGYYYSNAGVYGPVDHWGFNDLKLRLDFARDMEKWCPDAWLLQSGNPVFEGCTLMTRETGIKVVGLCDGPKNYAEICRVLGVEPEGVNWEAPGLNHQVWLTVFEEAGHDLYPLLDDWIANESEQFWGAHSQRNPHDIQMSRAAIHLYQMFGVMPLGDTVREPMNHWLHTDDETKRAWFGLPWGGPDTEAGRRAFIERLGDRLDRIAELAADERASVLDYIQSIPSYEMHVPIIDALSGNRSAVFQVNVPNRGTLNGVNDDVVVEVPATVSSEGIEPLVSSQLPRKVMLEQIFPRILQMEQALETFHTGDQSMLLWSVLMNSQTRSLEQAKSVLGDLTTMEGHEEFASHHLVNGQFRG